MEIINKTKQWILSWINTKNKTKIWLGEWIENKLK